MCISFTIGSGFARIFDNVRDETKQKVKGQVRISSFSFSLSFIYLMSHFLITRLEIVAICVCVLFVNYCNFCASRRAYIKNFMASFCISFAHAHARNTCVRCFLLKALCFDWLISNCCCCLAA